jgi:hypothetical protein
MYTVYTNKGYEIAHVKVKWRDVIEGMNLRLFKLIKTFIFVLRCDLCRAITAKPIPLLGKEYMCVTQSRYLFKVEYEY